MSSCHGFACHGFARCSERATRDARRAYTNINERPHGLPPSAANPWHESLESHLRMTALSVPAARPFRCVHLFPRPAAPTPALHPIARPAIIPSAALCIRPATLIAHLSKVRAAPLLGSATHLVSTIAIIAPAAHLRPATRPIKVRSPILAAVVLAARARPMPHLAAPRATALRSSAKLLTAELLSTLRPTLKLSAGIAALLTLARAVLLVMTMLLGKLLHRVPAMLSHFLARPIAAILCAIAPAIMRPISIRAHLALPIIAPRPLSQRIALPQIETQPHRRHRHQLVREIHGATPIREKFLPVPPTQPGRLSSQTLGRQSYCLFARAWGRLDPRFISVFIGIFAAITTGRGRWSAARLGFTFS